MGKRAADPGGSWHSPNGTPTYTHPAETPLFPKLLKIVTSPGPLPQGLRRRIDECKRCTAPRPPRSRPSRTELGLGLRWRSRSRVPAAPPWASEASFSRRDRWKLAPKRFSAAAAAVKKLTKKLT